jgi:zinc/manganese transport system permease protein
VSAAGDLLALPFLACLILAGIHAYLGLHVLARGVIKQLLVGSILSLTGDDVARVAALYGVIGAFHWFARRPLLALSLGGAPRHARLWDFLFYFTFGIVVTSSVRMAGVLLVFSYLIVPSVIGVWLATSLVRRLAIGWCVGSVVSAAGLAGSYSMDLPTGATIVATSGALLALVAIARSAVALATGLRRHGLAALRGAVVAPGVLAVVAGLALAIFPAADHYWLDALEHVAPSVQTAFLTAHERQVRHDSEVAIDRATAELASLRAEQADVQWGATRMAPEERERLRQFLVGRDEMQAGERLVLRTLRQHARERQRYALGIPVAATGAALVLMATRLSARRYSEKL